MSENNLLNNILKEFNIQYIDIKRLNKGYVSRKWLIKDIYNNIFILKESCITNSERLNYICYIQEQLNSISPKIYSSHDKKHITINNKFYILYEYIEGKQLKTAQINKKIGFEIGQFMGKLHNLMNNIKENGLADKKNTIGLNLCKPNIVKMNHLINYYKNHDTFYERILLYKLKFVKKMDYSKLMSKVENLLDKQIIHGDFYIDNIIFKNDQIYILDFDQAGIFYKLYELFRGMFFVCYDESKEENENIEKIKYFIKGYKTENNIENFDVAYEFYIYMLSNSLTCLDIKSSKNNNCRDFAIYRYNMLKWIISIKEVLIEFVNQI